MGEKKWGGKSEFIIISCQKPLAGIRPQASHRIPAQPSTFFPGSGAPKLSQIVLSVLQLHTRTSGCLQAALGCASLKSSALACSEVSRGVCDFISFLISTFGVTQVPKKLHPS